MTIKISGIDFKNFYNDKDFWPEDTYIDDINITINGKRLPDNKEVGDAVQDSDIITIVSGYIVDHPDGYDGSLLSYYKKWKKLQEKAYIVIEVEKDLLKNTIENLKYLNYKIVSK